MQAAATRRLLKSSKTLVDRLPNTEIGTSSHCPRGLTRKKWAANVIADLCSKTSTRSSKAAHFLGDKCDPTPELTEG